MKEVIVHPGPTAKLIDSPVPVPKQNEVLIKVIVTGSNPKDWKIPDWTDNSHNTGDDIAGTVEAIGQGADGYGLKIGDRVAAFHVMTSPHGSYAEYAIAPVHTTFPLPANTSFEQAATIPLAALTAACALFIKLGLPEPWKAGRENGNHSVDTVETGPLLIYGGASAIGAYGIKLAKRAGIGPLIVVAGRGIPFVQSLIDEKSGDKIVDYRQSDDQLVSSIKEALGTAKLMYAFDAVSEHGSYLNICKVLEPGGRITLVLPGRTYEGIPTNVIQSTTSVGEVHGPQSDFGYIWSRMFSKGLGEGWFTTHPYVVIPGGLNGVETALKNLKEGKASATKYVMRIAETK